MSKLGQIRDAITKGLDAELKIKCATTEIKRDGVRAEIIDASDSDKKFAIVITEPDAIPHIQEQFDLFLSRQLSVIVITPTPLSEAERENLHKKGLFTFLADDAEYHAYVAFLLHYIYVINEPKLSFRDFMTQLESKASDISDETDQRCRSFLKLYLDYNNALPFWSQTDLSAANLEYSILSATLTTERSARPSSQTEIGKTFRPSFTWTDSAGKSRSFPDIDSLKTPDNQLYVLNRADTSAAPILRYRYLELLMYWGSSSAERPALAKRIIAEIDNLITLEKANAHKFKFPGINLTTRYHRMIEIVNGMYSVFSDSERISYAQKYMDFLNDLWRNDIRWTLEGVENLILNTRVFDLLKANRSSESALFSMINAGVVHYESLGEHHLQRGFLKVKHLLEKEFKRANRLSQIREVAESYEKEALAAEAANNYPVAVAALETSIQIFSQAKSEFSEKISELTPKYKHAARESVKSLKLTEFELPKDTTDKWMRELEAQVGEIKNKSKGTGLIALFCNPQFVIAKETFEKNFESTNNSLFRIFANHIVDGERTVLKPSNDQEQRDIHYWSWYGKLVTITFQGLNFRMSNLLGSHFLLDDLEKFLREAVILSEDDFDILQRALANFFAGRYYEFSAIALPMLERFFRRYSGAELNFKKTGVDFPTSLDDFIKESVSLGFPDNVGLLARYMLAHKAGLNLRNLYAHGQLQFKQMNTKFYANLVLWLLLFCFLGFSVPDANAVEGQ